MRVGRIHRRSLASCYVVRGIAGIFSTTPSQQVRAIRKEIVADLSKPWTPDGVAAQAQRPEKQLADRVDVRTVRQRVKVHVVVQRATEALDQRDRTALRCAVAALRTGAISLTTSSWMRRPLRRGPLRRARIGYGCVQT
jgi:hypothetical protein